MGRPLIDLTGRKFGHLTVTSKADKYNDGQYYWNCLCNCGNSTKVLGTNLRNQTTKSCGCLARQLAKQRTTTHGQSRDNKLHDVWCSLKQRCYDKNYEGYNNYGGRGITVCKEWKFDFEVFRDYVSKLENCPSTKGSGYSIDRINTNKGYKPGNVKWSLHKNQTRNRRMTLFIKIEAKTITLAEQAEIEGIPYWKAWRKYKNVSFTK